MNTRPAIDESAGPVSLSVAFNQDSSCFSVGLDTGFCGTREIANYVNKGELIRLGSVQCRALRAQSFTRYVSYVQYACLGAGV